VQSLTKIVNLAENGPEPSSRLGWGARSVLLRVLPTDYGELVPNLMASGSSREEGLVAAMRRKTLL
jgi:hypothetical protein